MSTLVKEAEIIGNKEKAKVKILFDSGATNSLIRKEIAERVSSLTKWPKPIDFKLADGKTVVRSEFYVALIININGNEIPGQLLHVVTDIEEDLILGVDAFQRWKFKLDFEKEDVIVDKEMLKLKIV